jgi:site-specific DNA-adenine methylase
MKKEKQLKPPFSYFGAKTRTIDQVWGAFGNPEIYVEPFCGGLGNLLGNPRPCTVEIVNDLDYMLINMWRALIDDCEAVWDIATTIPEELTLRQAHEYLSDEKTKQEVLDKLKLGIRSYHIEAAGWWLYRQSNSIGLDMSCSMIRGTNAGVKALYKRNPEYRKQLVERLRYVQVMHGDWKRCVTNAVLTISKKHAIFFDPPYGVGQATYENNQTKTILEDVWNWSIEHSKNINTKIIICQYDLIDIPEGWTAHEGKGYGTGHIRNNDNHKREMMYFSPGCNTSHLTNPIIASDAS